MIAQGAEAKVYYRSGDPSVVKERTSIYSTWQKALEAIALHNYLFPETSMLVTGFTRDSDNLMRIILTQPYVSCRRLATKDEIDQMVAAKGFRDNWYGQGVNYISDRMALEDMHPANVFEDKFCGGMNGETYFSLEREKVSDPEGKVSDPGRKVSDPGRKVSDRCPQRREVAEDGAHLLKAEGDGGVTVGKEERHATGSVAHGLSEREAPINS